MDSEDDPLLQDVWLEEEQEEEEVLLTTEPLGQSAMGMISV